MGGGWHWLYGGESQECNVKLKLKYYPCNSLALCWLWCIPSSKLASMHSTVSKHFVFYWPTCVLAVLLLRNIYISAVFPRGVNDYLVVEPAVFSVSGASVFQYVILWMIMNVRTLDEASTVPQNIIFLVACSCVPLTSSDLSKEHFSFSFCKESESLVGTHFFH